MCVCAHTYMCTYTHTYVRTYTCEQTQNSKGQCIFRWQQFIRRRFPLCPLCHVQMLRVCLRSFGPGSKPSPSYCKVKSFLDAASSRSQCSGLWREKAHGTSLAQGIPWQPPWGAAPLSDLQRGLSLSQLCSQSTRDTRTEGLGALPDPGPIQSL